MIIDFETTDVASGSLPRTIVIGSGPVGLAVAAGLRRRGIAVAVIEGGPAKASASSDLNDGDILGLPFTGMFKRGRGLGGGTSEWAGQCLRFHSSDFQRRDWVDGSGWPIDYDDLAQFYSEAEQYFDVSADGYLARVWRDFGLEPAGLIDTEVLVRFSAFAKQPRVFDRDRRLWARDRDGWLICNATATGLRREGSRIDRVEIQSPHGKSLTLPVDTVVLCVGGIEAARMMLEPMADFPSGIGSGNRHIGLHLQDHPNRVIGVLDEFSPGQGTEDAVRYFSSLYRNGRRYLPRLVLSAARQRELGVLNGCGFAVFEWPPESVTENLRQLQAAVAGRRFDMSMTSRVARAFNDPRSLARTVGARLRGHSFGETPSAVLLQGFAEQDPMTSSKVTLSNRTDKFGRPFASVDWRLGERERETLVTLAREVNAYLVHNRVARLTLPDELLESGDAWKSGVNDNQHHVGTTRMATSEHDGVVDSNGKVFGFPNLYISGGAVMPTGSYANPTLTMTALGFRLASHLAKVALRR